MERVGNTEINPGAWKSKLSRDRRLSRVRHLNVQELSAPTYTVYTTWRRNPRYFTNFVEYLRKLPKCAINLTNICTSEKRNRQMPRTFYTQIRTCVPSIRECPQIAGFSLSFRCVHSSVSDYALEISEFLLFSRFEVHETGLWGKECVFFGTDGFRSKRDEVRYLVGALLIHSEIKYQISHTWSPLLRNPRQFFKACLLLKHRFSC